MQMSEIKYIVFTLGDQRYCTKLDKIKGIEQDYVIVPVPAGAENIKGIIHLREEVIPIYDIKQKFNMDDCNDGDKQILVAETHDMKIGIEVDSVLAIVSVDEKDIKPTPKVVMGDETGYLDGVVKIDNVGNFNAKADIVLSIGIDTIMSEEEFEAVIDSLDNSGEDLETEEEAVSDEAMFEETDEESISDETDEEETDDDGFEYVVEPEED